MTWVRWLVAGCVPRTKKEKKKKRRGIIISFLFNLYICIIIKYRDLETFFRRAVCARVRVVVLCFCCDESWGCRNNCFCCWIHDMYRCCCDNTRQHLGFDFTTKVPFVIIWVCSKWQQPVFGASSSSSSSTRKQKQFVFRNGPTCFY